MEARPGRPCAAWDAARNAGARPHMVRDRAVTTP
jgi:hypothetical protein